MSTYLVVDVTVKIPELFKEYVRKSQPLVAKHGGNYLVRGGDIEIREGTWDPQRLVVVEFTNKENARSFLDDPDYQRVAAIRHEAATTNMIIADGYEAAP